MRFRERRALCSAILPTLAVALCGGSCRAALPMHPGNSVCTAKARFQVLTPTLMRMELAPDGRFVDEPSAVVLRRHWPVRKFKVSKEGGWLLINTGRMTLKYRLGSDRFDAGTLKVTWGTRGMWKPGQADEANLGGSPRHCLDLLKSVPEPATLHGVISRSGWFLLNDSASPIYDPSTNWIRPRAKPGSKDLYLFVYGRDYKRALREYAELLGPVPMVPRWSLGAWFSRFWEYPDWELKDIVTEFRRRHVPLDVLVLDMDWHDHGFEGYDWNKEHFPDPEGFLRWCHEQGLRVTLNNHPGILPIEESRFAEVRGLLGFPGSGYEPVEFNLADQKHAKVFMEVLHNPLIDLGVDFWWVDGWAARMDGLNNQFWTSHVYYTFTQERLGQTKRAFQLARWGGHGSHRYPCGFSGDTYSEWGVLRHEVKLTPMAGNVLWQWSHDIGGHHGDYIGEELYLRWVQFGVFSPFFRLHSNHGRRLPWEYGEKAAAVAKSFFELRYRMLPYTYTLFRELNQKAVSPCRPLYIEWPNEGFAYEYPYEYMFGPNLLVAPATEHTRNGVTNVRVFLPPGKWFDFFTGRPYRGGREIRFACPLERMPVFARAGAIIPMQPEMQFFGQKPIDPLTLCVYRGADGDFEMYEDDGVSLAYQRGEFATTRFRLRDRADGFAVMIGAVNGGCAGAPDRRSYVLRICGAVLPRRVMVAGREIAKSTGTGVGWRVDRKSGALEIRLGGHPTSRSVTVEVRGG